MAVTADPELVNILEYLMCRKLQSSSIFIKSKSWQSLLKKTKILQYFMKVYAAFTFVLSELLYLLITATAKTQLGFGMPEYTT